MFQLKKQITIIQPLAPSGLGLLIQGFEAGRNIHTLQSAFLYITYSPHHDLFQTHFLFLHRLESFLIFCHQISYHVSIRMVNIGRLLLDPNFKKISSIGEYLRLIVMYWEASQNLRGAVKLAL